MPRNMLLGDNNERLTVPRYSRHVTNTVQTGQTERDVGCSTCHMARHANGLLARPIIKSDVTSPRHNGCCCCCCCWKWCGCSGWHDVMGNPRESPGGDDVTQGPAGGIRGPLSSAGGLSEVVDGAEGDSGSSLGWRLGDGAPDNIISLDLSFNFLLFIRRFWNQTFTCQQTDRQSGRQIFNEMQACISFVNLAVHRK